jgi:myo-inositol-1(or 4)-monophosphatase
MPADEQSQFLNVAVTAAQRAGKIIRENLGHISKDDIGLKKESDFVTRVDTESERIIINTIKERFPGHSFLAEESAQETETDSYRWIIDPLDGTTNYIHQYPVFAVSIALEYKRERIAGVIYDPLRNDLFTAVKGKGAFLNGNRIAVSPVRDLKYSLISTGFPFRQKERIDLYLRLFKNIFNRVSDMRRAGSAALDLAYLACGRCEGFFEIGLSPWDVAAGALMITEAGGVVTDFNGGNNFLSTGNIIAGTPVIHGELLGEVKKVFAGIISE